MTKTYAQVMKQIDSLKLEAEKLRSNEVSGVVERIRHAISVYNLTAADLGLGQGQSLGQSLGQVVKGKVAASKAEAPVKRRKRKGAAAKAPRVIKFRNDSGGAWGGIGKRPQWLRLCASCA